MTNIEIIKEKVRIEDILSRYWSEPDRNGRYKCAFHNGKDYNMLVKNGFAYCFVCNESADCVKLTSIIFGITIGEAIKKINEDFGLGLSRRLTALEKKKLAEEQKAREAEKQRKENLDNFERDCLQVISEKLRVGYEYLSGEQFNCIVEAEKSDSDIFEIVMYRKAKERVRWLEWLWCLLTGDTHYLVEEDFCSIYGTDKVEILRNIYKGEVVI